jgi:hypothetical protein
VGGLQLHPLDIEDVKFRCYQKFSQTLEAIVSKFSYVDSFRVLFPCTRAFSWHKRGQLAARLHWVYLPPLLKSRLVWLTTSPQPLITIPTYFC